MTIEEQIMLAQAQKEGQVLSEAPVAGVAAGALLGGINTLPVKGKMMPGRMATRALLFSAMGGLTGEGVRKAWVESLPTSPMIAKVAATPGGVEGLSDYDRMLYEKALANSIRNSGMV